MSDAIKRLLEADNWDERRAILQELDEQNRREWHLTVDDLDSWHLFQIMKFLLRVDAPAANAKPVAEAVLLEFRTQSVMRLEVLKDAVWTGAVVPEDWKCRLEYLLSDLREMRIDKRLDPSRTWTSGLIPHFCIRDEDGT